MTRSDYQREVRAQQGRGSRLRLPHSSLTDEVPARYLPHIQASASTVTDSMMTRSGYQHEVRAPEGRGSRPRLPH
eukprot:3776709-Pyramimonas_sp.AAC.1